MISRLAHVVVCAAIACACACACAAPRAPRAPIASPAAVSSAAVTPANAPAPPALPEDTASLRAVFHMSEPSRAAVSRGLSNAQNALAALGDENARFVLVVHGQAMQWLRRDQAENLGAQIGALLATGKVDLRVCQKTLDEHHWRLEDLVPGATAVPSGTLEVLRLQRAGYVYFHP